MFIYIYKKDIGKEKSTKIILYKDKEEKGKWEDRSTIGFADSSERGRFDDIDVLPHVIQLRSTIIIIKRERKKKCSTKEKKRKGKERAKGETNQERNRERWKGGELRGEDLLFLGVIRIHIALFLTLIIKNDSKFNKSKRDEEKERQQ